MDFMKDINLCGISVFSKPPILWCLDNHVRISTQLDGFVAVYCDDGRRVGRDMIPSGINLRAWISDIDGSVLVVSPKRMILSGFIKIDGNATIENRC
jgi:hypothetical protein